MGTKRSEQYHLIAYGAGPRPIEDRRSKDLEKLRTIANGLGKGVEWTINDPRGMTADANY